MRTHIEDATLTLDAREPVRPRRQRSLDPLVWFFRALLLVPFVLMGPEIVAAARAQPHGLANLSASNADVLGTSTFIVFALMLAVTPIATATGWRWHIILRRDYGVGMFAIAATDIIIAAIATGDTFPGGVLARLGGHSFLWAGSISTAMCIPLAITANRRSQRWLGRHWRFIQRITYVVWGTILIHLLLLFGFRSFALDALLASAALIVLRLPPARHWFVVSRHARTNRIARASLALVLAGTFVAGMVPFVKELAVKGSAAFVQRPVDD